MKELQLDNISAFDLNKSLISQNDIYLELLSEIREIPEFTKINHDNKLLKK